MKHVFFLFGFLSIVFAPVIMANSPPEKKGNCLKSTYEWIEKEQGDVPTDKKTLAFDQRFDETMDGGKFSCGLYTTASIAHSALEKFRALVVYSDEAQTDVLNFPVTVNYFDDPKSLKKSLTKKINNVQEWRAFRKKEISPELEALISCSNVKNVTVIKDEGFFIFFGGVWFQQQENRRDYGISVFNIRKLMTNEMFVHSCAGYSSR